MALVLDPVAVFNAATGVLLVVFGAWVARLRPRRRGNLVFAAFAIVFGIAWVPENLVRPPDPLAGLSFQAYTLLLVASAALVPLVGLWVPRPLPPGSRRTLVLPAGVALVAAALSVAALAVAPPELYLDYAGHVPFAWIVLNQAVSAVLLSCWVFVTILLPLRYRRARPELRERRQYALLAAAFLLFPGFVAGYDVFYGVFALRLEGLLALVGFALASVLWLRNTLEGPAESTATARDLALLCLGVPLVGIVAAILFGVDGPHFGSARAASVALLGYAVLRHQLLGTDVRVKWTLQQSTVAAAFIGVFFVVSESASQFFADADGGLGLGTYLGIAAAGLLVFAIAPLQRVAERLADTAMPGVRPLQSMDPDERLRVYRTMAASAWTDGSVSRDERALLDRLRTELGLSPEEALRIESETARA